MLNPYATTSACSDRLDLGAENNWQRKLFLYFAIFELSFASFYILIVCFNLGFVVTLSGLLESPTDIVELLVLGFAVWIPHGILLLVGKLCSGRCNIITPILGAAGFAVALLIFETACDILACSPFSDPLE